MRLIPFYVIILLMNILYCCKNDPKLEEKTNQNLNDSLDDTRGKLDSVLQQLEILKEAQKNNPIENLGLKYEKLKKGVYLILCKIGGQISQGSAFVVSGDGTAISNYHVFEDAEAAVAIDHLGNYTEIDLNSIEVYDKYLDFVIFNIPHSGKNALNVSNFKMRVGDECFAIGNPEGLQLSLSTGIVSGFRNGDTLIQTTASITHGSSGGPLFNSIGEVIGITTSFIDKGNLNFAVNLSYVLANKTLKTDSEILPTQTEPHEHNKTHPQKLYNAENIIRNYYNLVLTQDFDELRSFYADSLERFHKLRNISSEDAINDHRNYYNRWSVTDFQVESVSIFYNSQQGTYSGESYVKMSIQRKSDGLQKNYLIKSYIKLNNEGKVFEINEEILKSN